VKAARTSRARLCGLPAAAMPAMVLCVEQQSLATGAGCSPGIFYAPIM